MRKDKNTPYPFNPLPVLLCFYPLRFLTASPAQLLSPTIVVVADLLFLNRIGGIPTYSVAHTLKLVSLVYKQILGIRLLSSPAMRLAQRSIQLASEEGF